MENCERFRGKGGEQTLLVQTAVTRDDEKKQTMLHLGSSDAKRILLHQSGFSPLKQTAAVTMDGAKARTRIGANEEATGTAARKRRARTRHWQRHSSGGTERIGGNST
jgi:hypothetical protein